MSHGLEIERKFLVPGDDWPRVRGVRIRQGYLSEGGTVSVRVRTAGDEAFLTVKSARAGTTRDEFEYPIPAAEAASMLGRMVAGDIIEKTRYHVEHDGLTWEVDEFDGANRGLVVAEIELGGETDEITLPPWIGREITAEARYYNAALARHPYDSWSEAETNRDGS